MDTAEVEWLRELSRPLFGNAFVLPVAAAVLAVRAGDIRSTPVIQVLGGRLPLKDVLRGFDRLVQIGALEELPYPGQPHPRIFSRRADPFWDFVASYVVQHADADR
jgi:hypothetical protein